MIHRLPTWVLSGGAVLAAVAGMINVIALLSFEHQAVSHLTGNTSYVAAALAQLDFTGAAHFGSILLAFFLGTAVSGFLIQDSTLRLGRRYGVGLSLVGALLIVAVPLFESRSSLGLYAAALACGLQNAMVSTYSGAVVRTTHLSGMFTDLGIALGHWLRGMPVEMRRVSLCLLVIGGFSLGGVLGALGFHRLGYAALYLPAGLVLAAALGYAVLHYRGRAG
ncbi:YoaK family protein [uncultured Aquimonas sp.]|uniref:YoaK family protein n=1 Tax=uncultured Aquimonas sp. TaxID=385483 RepID=UPI00086F334E|nr:YoaK family protein [uncultured Aquimonas sp.]ODU40471.1 MAG: hypothetical protein ABS96_35070 [Xanthomonadaceae bacterium SCN 69-123]